MQMCMKKNTLITENGTSCKKNLFQQQVTLNKQYLTQYMLLLLLFRFYKYLALF